jgi:hypothetical protein
MGNAKLRPIVIKSKIVPGTNDVEFEMLDRGKVNHRPAFDKTADQMLPSDYHEVVFTLKNGPGLKDLRFAPNIDDVMWVVKGTATEEPPCPKTRVPKHPDFYAVDPIEPLQLTAHNLNPVRAFYAFTLNFERTGHADLIPFDPIGDNRDGGLGKSNNALLALGGVVFVGLALIIGLKERADRIRKERS